MALEGIPSAGSAPTSGASISPGAAAAAPGASAGSAGGRPAAAGSAAGAKTSGASNAAGTNGASTASSTDPNATPSDFTTVLAGTLNAVAPAASAATDEPKIAAKSADDDATDDEIGFEDLSEFLAQVLVPAGSNPAVPAAAASDSEATVEIDFMQDENGGLSSQLASALSADARGKAALSAAQDRFATSMATADLALAADASVLKDALASEKTVAAALDPSAVAPTADAGGDVDSLTAATGFSPLHAAALHSSHSTAHATLQAEVRSPMGTQAWADEVGGHLTWMASHGRESASLTLTPEHLGPIEVRITTQDGQTSVWFGAQNADTRSAIEQALPRLRELFSSQGLSLADSGVFREAPRQQPQNFSDAANGSSNGDAASVVTSVAKRGNGILDLYA